MERSELVLDASPESVREHVARAAPGARGAAAGGRDHTGSAAAVTVRQATHRLFVVWHHVAMTTFTPRPRPTATPATADPCSCPGWTTRSSPRTHRRRGADSCGHPECTTSPS